MLELAQQLRDSFQQEYGDGKPNALLIQGLPERFQALTDDLCSAYATAAPEECAQVRQIISANRLLQSCFLGNVIRASRKIQSEADLKWLEIGLAFASIEDCRIDYRDSFLALAELYVAAEKANLDAHKAFQAMASRSSTEKPRGGSTPMHDILFNFDTYAVLAERRAMRKSYFPIKS